MEARRTTETTSSASSEQATVVADPSREAAVGSGSSLFPLSRILKLTDALAEVAPSPDVSIARRRERTRTGTGVVRRSSRLKRAMDIAGAITLLLLTSPIMLLTAVLVRLGSSGPVIFKQTRTGLNLRDLSAEPRRDPRGSIPCRGERRAPGVRDRRTSQLFGRPFVLYKFRTMCAEAEKNGPQLARVGDPRVTAVGRLLRRTRIDELPQLWNVLRGDMSLVGPRPERPELIKELSEVIPTYLGRLDSKPGLTGLAQVKNGYDTSLESFRRKVQLDIHYLRNWSIWQDLRILWQTISVVITGKGAC